MVASKKKIKDYLKQSMRKLKHRKGYGVHSPFAYSIITEVIEEKLPYYAYRRMQRTFDKQAPIPFKVACLLLRLANRFGCRNVAEVGCDGGYSILPLILTDSRLHVSTLADAATANSTADRLAWLPNRMQQVTFHDNVDQFCNETPFDFIVINSNPFEPLDAQRLTPEQRQAASEQLVQWVMANATDHTLIFVHGIQPRHRLENFWDLLCDRDDVTITMDLYDYGLAILKPRFFKQHYIVSF